MLKFDTKLTLDKALMLASNLASKFTVDDLTKISGAVWDGYQADIQSRAAWAKRNEAGMDLAMQISKAKNFPWPNCSNIVFPLVTIAAMQFSARSYANIIQGADVVSYRVKGEDPSGDLTAKSQRLGAHMSWQLLEEDTAWEEQHDRMLINDCIVGTSIIKSYYSPSKGHNVNELVLAKDFVINYFAKSCEDAARKTHVIPLYRNELFEKCAREVFTDIRKEDWFQEAPVYTMSPGEAEQANRHGTTPPTPDKDSPFITLEQHCLFDFDGDGYAEPYIITIEQGSQKVLRIVARWDNEAQVERDGRGKLLCIRPTEYFTKFGFIPSPDGGFYDIGFGVLLGPLNEAVNTSINQIFDAATMNNSNGGFLGKGAKIRGGTYTFAPWEWKRVDSTGDDLRKNIVHLEKAQISPVLFSMLNLLINYVDRISGSTDIMVGENPGQNTPAETSRNMLEQGMQVYSTIFKRIWRSLKEEFRKNHDLNAVYLPDKQSFGEGQYITREEYKNTRDLCRPVADPHMSSDAQRMQKALAISQRAEVVNGYDRTVVERNLLKAMRVEGIDKFFPGPEKVPQGKDPKITLKEMDLQMKQMQLQQEQQQFALAQLEIHRFNTAQIQKLRADAAVAMAQVKGAAAAHQLATFNSVIDAMAVKNDQILQQLQLTMGAKKDGINSGGVGGGEAAA